MEHTKWFGDVRPLLLGDLGDLGDSTQETQLRRLELRLHSTGMAQVQSGMIMIGV